MPDIIGPGLKVLFCGINPGLYSAAVGPPLCPAGNRFWTTLFRAGFTDRLIAPSDERQLLSLGYGITNIVNFATGQASELSPQTLQAGAAVLSKKVTEFRPRLLAVLGIDAYRKASCRPGARVGRQAEGLGGTSLGCCRTPAGSTPAIRWRIWREFFGIKGACRKSVI